MGLTTEVRMLSFMWRANEDRACQPNKPGDKTQKLFFHLRGGEREQNVQSAIKYLALDLVAHELGSIPRTLS